VNLHIWLVTAALVSTTAYAAPSPQALDAALRAVRLDFARDGVVASPDEVKGAYREACDLGYDLACRSETWHGEVGLADLAKAGALFAKACSKTDPVACIVEGWSIEAQPLPTWTADSDRNARRLEQLKQASQRYRTGCTSASAFGPCHELARYSRERAELTVGSESGVYDKGARSVFEDLCKRGHQPSCVALGTMLPSAPELLDKPGSAGFLFQKSCDAGYVDGCHRLGLLVASNRAEAENRHWFQGLCDRGHVASCVWLARSYPPVNGAVSDDAVSAWKRACLLHSAEGCQKSGVALEAQRPAEAMQVLRMGCALGDGVACGRLGLMLVAQDQAPASVQFLDRGCSAGLGPACVKVGLMRLEGRLIDPDPVRARTDLERGCNEEKQLRDPEACHALGRVYEDGFGVERDRAVAARYYNISCKGGNMSSCFRVGESVAGLQSASKSDGLQEWALNGYVKACDAGIAQACLPAAELYATGPVGVRDPAQARQRFTELCEGGNQLACRRFGQWLVTNPVEPKDLQLARDVFGKGMDLGDTESARQLAKMYYAGLGGPVSRGKARRLFKSACKAGNGLACGGMSQPDFVRP
jgi:hypothetical protein